MKRGVLFGLSLGQLLVIEGLLIGLTLSAGWMLFGPVGLVPLFGLSCGLLFLQEYWLIQLRTINDGGRSCIMNTGLAVTCTGLALAIWPTLFISAVLGVLAVMGYRQSGPIVPANILPFQRRRSWPDPGRFTLWSLAGLQFLVSLDLLILGRQAFDEFGLQFAAAVVFSACLLGHACLNDHHGNGRLTAAGIFVTGVITGVPLMLLSQLVAWQTIGLGGVAIGALGFCWAMTDPDVEWSTTTWDPRRPIFQLRRAPGRQPKRFLTTRGTPRAS